MLGAVRPGVNSGAEKNKPSGLTAPESRGLDVFSRGVQSPTYLERLTIFLCGVGLLIGMVAVNLWFGVLAARTVVFLTPMLMLTAGYGLSRLEGRAQGVFAALLIGLMLLQPQIVQPRLDGDLAAQAVAADYTPAT